MYKAITYVNFVKQVLTNTAVYIWQPAQLVCSHLMDEASEWLESVKFSFWRPSRNEGQWNSYFHFTSVSRWTGSPRFSSSRESLRLHTYIPFVF